MIMFFFKNISMSMFETVKLKPLSLVDVAFSSSLFGIFQYFSLLITSNM